MKIYIFSLIAFLFCPYIFFAQDIVCYSESDSYTQSSINKNKAVKSTFKNATPTIGMSKYKEEVIRKLRTMRLSDAKEYKITAIVKVLSTGIVYDVEIKKAPSMRHAEDIKKVFKETSSWFPAKRSGAFVDNDVKITVKVKGV